MTSFRRRLAIKGFVQGVGFRPFIYRLAERGKLSGWVANDSDGVVIEVQGALPALEAFAEALVASHPRNASIHRCDVVDIPPVEESEFFIRESLGGSKSCIFLLPDIAVCQACLREVMDPNNRRFGYPFTNCTDCGPRFSIIEELPYDRKNTTMRGFKMCAACLEEYENPLDRRFHAQPNGCPECGPKLQLWDGEGRILAEKGEALREACLQIRRGAIVALKGIGGFQLIADAKKECAVQTLRERKRRPDKPFALMYRAIEQVKKECILSALEEELLLSKEAPLVIVKAKNPPQPWIAPNNPCIAAMLPYTPLHFLMLQSLGGPVVATSGNRSSEPICVDEREALRDLCGVADYFLVHDRPIAHPIDDSIVRVLDEKKTVLRRARGYSSIPLSIEHPLPPSLAVGGHLKNTIALGCGPTIYLSQHLGDLDTEKGCRGFSEAIRKASKIYGIDPEIVVADSHPGYHSTREAEEMGKSLLRCQHHEAHLFSCMAEQKIDPPLLGVCWDGTGYGADGTIWGGEFFRVEEDFSVKRVATIRPFRLLCGEKAIVEPRLAALALLYEIFGAALFADEREPLHLHFSPSERANYEKLLSGGAFSPLCSSMGRLFDGIGALLGVRQKATFEGQAAMELEFLCGESRESGSYEFAIAGGVIDWEAMVREILRERGASVPFSDIARKFHNTLARMIAAVAEKERLLRIALSGGVFQNKRLIEGAVEVLREKGYIPYTHSEIPPNDGGIACGQLYREALQFRRRSLLQPGDGRIG